ncbi:hypothetical protein [Streptomyces griseorubens]|uniref:hypothetical protein n=1 Tax=Streptomyces griseorubens TaxID=66897 RepID=UPI001AD7F55F|nr:hypothetical protein [Streptomyces griseorubens]
MLVRLPGDRLHNPFHDRSHHTLVRDTHRLTERQRGPLHPRPRMGLGAGPRRLLTARLRRPRLGRPRIGPGHGLRDRPGVRPRAPLALQRVSSRAQGAPGRLLGLRPVGPGHTSVAARREAVQHGSDAPGVHPHHPGGRAVRGLGPLPEQDAQDEHRPRHQRQPHRTPAGRGAHHARGGPGQGCC